MFLKILAYVQYILPQHTISWLLGKVDDIKFKPFKNWQIKKFIKKNKIDMHRVLIEDINQYACFNDFFTRKLKTSAMGKSNSNEIASPAEATITQFGIIEQNQLLQAKNKTFTLENLLVKEEKLIHYFKNGSYIIFFLKPHNYHRYHMPITGELVQSIFVPGKLFGVDFYCQDLVSNLYCRNERYITIFKTEIGYVGIILIGAFLVGSIQPVWMPKAIRYHKITHQKHPALQLQKAEELGLFKSGGSSIILLFEPNKIRFKQHLQEMEWLACDPIADIII